MRHPADLVEHQLERYVHVGAVPAGWRESFTRMLDILNQVEDAAPMSPAQHAYSIMKCIRDRASCKYAHKAVEHTLEHPGIDSRQPKPLNNQPQKSAYQIPKTLQRTR